MKHPCRAGPDQAFWCADGAVLLCLLSGQSWIDEDSLLSEVSVSLQSHYVSGCIFLLSGRPPPYPIPPPPPVCQRGTAPSSSVHPLYPNAFLQGRLLFIPSGGLTVNLLHWGKFLGMGPGSVGILPQPLVLGPSLYIYVFLLLSVYPNNHPTPHATSPFGLLFQSGPLLRDEYLARLQLPFISSYSKLKDSIKGPLYCQKSKPPSTSFPLSLCALLSRQKEVLGPSDGLVWAICRLKSSVSASLGADICSGHISIYCVNLFLRTIHFF